MEAWQFPGYEHGCPPSYLLNKNRKGAPAGTPYLRLPYLWWLAMPDNTKYLHVVCYRTQLIELSIKVWAMVLGIAGTLIEPPPL